MRILLVDDDQLIRFVHQMFIERAGHVVVGVAEEESQAVALALELKPDVVIMDIRLENGSNGISAMKTIQQTLDIPAIYISGNSDTRTLDEAEQTIMKSFLVKPVTQDEIAKALSS
jgi:DNA-binding NarL/FixJ family response regulator